MKWIAGEIIKKSEHITKEVIREGTDGEKIE
jgi:hypothetical protein